MSYVDEAIAVLAEIRSKNKNSTVEKLNRGFEGETFVLRYLISHEVANPKEMGEALGCTNGRISAILNSLEKKGQITRETDKVNRRNVLVTLTDTGRGRAQTETKALQDQLAQIFEIIGEHDTKEMIRLLRLFIETKSQVLDSTTSNNELDSDQE